MKPVETSQYL